MTNLIRFAHLTKASIKSGPHKSWRCSMMCSLISIELISKNIILSVQARCKMSWINCWRSILVFKTYEWETSDMIYLEARLDDCVGNESLETLYWLKWGFVIMIIGYIYSQKCNENAKKKRLIYFELWKHFFVYILKKRLPEFKM